MSTPRGVRDDAVRHLARRALSRAELRQRLVRGGHAASAVEAVVEDLAQAGVIDDAALAHDFVAARAARWGRRRLVAALEARGVTREVAEAAWRRAVAEGQVEAGSALARSVAKRLARGVRLDEREYARVYNALLREGFDPEEIESALASHRALPDGSVEVPAERNDDDLR